MQVSYIIKLCGINSKRFYSYIIVFNSKRESPFFLYQCGSHYQSVSAKIKSAMEHSYPSMWPNRQATKSKSPSKYDLPLIFHLFGLYNGCWWFPKPHSTTFNHSGNVSWPQWGTVNFGTFLNNLRIHCWTGGRRMIM